MVNGEQRDAPLLASQRFWPVCELRALSSRITRRLDTLLAPGEEVALLIGNEGTSVALLSAALAGLRPALLLPRSASLQELRLVLEQSGVRLLALAAGSLPHDVKQGLSVWKQQEDAGVVVLYRESPLGPSPFAALRGHPHVGQLTSGSTGASLLAIRSLQGVRAEAGAVAGALELAPGDRLLCASSIAHSYAFVGGLCGSLRTGAQLALAGGPDEAPDLVQAFRPTVIFGLAGTYSSLLRCGDRSGLAQVRLALSAGAPLPSGLHEAFLRWSGIPIRQDYGTTETGTISLDFPGDPDPSAVGFPLSHIEIRIGPVAEVRDGETHARSGGSGTDESVSVPRRTSLSTGQRSPTSSDPVRLGSMGEVQVRSPHIAGWYLGAGQLVPCADADGWYHTGDLAALDQSGRLRLRGRIQPRIVVRGALVDPQAIETAMMACPGLRQVAVVPLDGPEGSVLLKAVVVAPGLSAEQTRRWCAERLPPQFVPDSIELRESLPYSPAGKLLRKHLL